METLTANQAKNQFGDLLLKAQRTPVEISRTGKTWVSCELNELYKPM